MSSLPVITPGLLKQAFMLPQQRADRWAPFIGPAVQLAGITTTLQLAHFFAQLGHESARLLYVREIWGPTSAQVRYERVADAPWPRSPAEARLPAFAANKLAFTLGNTRAGDGKRYMGRGLIQTTGRGNYIVTTDRLKDLIGENVPDFVTAPALLENPDWAAASAAQYWRDRKLNQWADKDDIVTLTKRVNGGLNGLADRQLLLSAAKAAITRVLNDVA